MVGYLPPSPNPRQTLERMILSEAREVRLSLWMWSRRRGGVLVEFSLKFQGRADILIFDYRNIVPFLGLRDFFCDKSEVQKFDSRLHEKALIGSDRPTMEERPVPSLPNFPQSSKPST